MEKLKKRTKLYYTKTEFFKWAHILMLEWDSYTVGCSSFSSGKLYYEKPNLRYHLFKQDYR